MQEHVVCTTVKTFDDTQFLRTHRARRAQCRVVRHARGLLPASASAPYLLYAASSRHLRCACFYLHYAVSTCITQRSTCFTQRVSTCLAQCLPALRSVLPALSSVYLLHAAFYYLHYAASTRLTQRQLSATSGVCVPPCITQCTICVARVYLYMQRSTCIAQRPQPRVRCSFRNPACVFPLYVMHRSPPGWLLFCRSGARACPCTWSVVTSAHACSCSAAASKCACLRHRSVAPSAYHAYSVRPSPGLPYKPSSAHGANLIEPRSLPAPPALPYPTCLSRIYPASRRRITEGSRTRPASPPGVTWRVPNRLWRCVGVVPTTSLYVSGPTCLSYGYHSARSMSPLLRALDSPCSSSNIGRPRSRNSIKSLFSTCLFRLPCEVLTRLGPLGRIGRWAYVQGHV